MLVKAERSGKKTYYTQIIQPGLINGHEIWGYTYDQPVFDKNGKGHQLGFPADTSLRSQAYLRVYVSGDGHVTTWKEAVSS